MKTKVIIILLLIISLGINIGLLIRLTHQKALPRRITKYDIRHGWRKGGLRHHLNLNENQLKAMEAVNESTFTRMDALRETLELKRRELISILKESEPDNSKIQRLLKEIADLQTRMELNLTENILAIKKVLTAEQQEQFFELFQRRLGHHAEFKIKKRRRRQ